MKIRRIMVALFVGAAMLMVIPAASATGHECPGVDPAEMAPPGANIVEGTPGDDELMGTAGVDFIIGYGGNDTIYGFAGDDWLAGCAGDDRIYGGNGNDMIAGDALDFFGDPESTDGGDDVLFGGNGDDEILAGPGDDNARGGKGNDHIFLNQGDDVAAGGGGHDNVFGGFGIDEVRGNKGYDVVSGGPHNDVVYGGEGADSLAGDTPTPAGFEVPEGDSDHCDGGPAFDHSWDCESNRAVNDVDNRFVDIQLLAFNDYHGHLQPDSSVTVAGEPAGGGEYLSAKLNELREGNRDSLTVAAGDLIGASPAFSGLFHDEPSVESLNVMELDVSSVGNHEFDEGVTELLRMQDGGCHPVDGCYFEGDPYAGADYQWLAANVVHEDSGDTPLPPYWVKRIRGVKVGFIGMTLEATDTLVAASGIEGWDFLDEAETANALVPELHDKGVEAIVVLLHEGGSQNPAPGNVDECKNISGPIVAINEALDPAIDAVITGHTHLPYNCVIQDSGTEPRIVTSAYSYGRVVSEIDLKVDGATRDIDRYETSATNHAVIRADLTADAAITAVIAKWQPLFDVAGNTPVGEVTADINRGGDPPGDDRGVESAAGNMVADAQLLATLFNGAELALMNPGGLRSDLTYAESQDPLEGDGVVTFGEAFTFQPFGNTLFTFPMTGAQVMSVLEEQCQPAGSSRPFLHLGVSEGVTYDLAWTTDGTDCTSITISNVMVDGESLDLGASYWVTANNFLADGGDNFTTFAEIDPALRLDGGNDLQGLIAYFDAVGAVDPPSTDRVNEL